MTPNEASRKPYFYLASPYSHPLDEIREFRFRAVSQAAGRLLDLEIATYTPIAMTHPIEREIGSRPLEVWLSLDLPILRRAAGLIELQLPGWSRSTGMGREREFAREMGVPIFMLEPDSLVESGLLRRLNQQERTDVGNQRPGA